MAGRLFLDKTAEQQAETLKAFLPGGRPFFAAGMDGTKLAALMHGLAVETWRAENLMNDITYEHQIDQTTLLIEEWEKALGIPDECFTTTVSLEQRRKQVIAKLAASIQTAEDFVAFASFLGYDITTIPGRDLGLFPFERKFPIMFFDKPVSARYYMLVTIYLDYLPNVFPLNFPLPFGPEFAEGITCLLNKLIPVNVSLLFAYELYDRASFISEPGFDYLVTEDGLDFISPEF